MAQYNELLTQIDYLSADAGYKGTNLTALNNLVVKFDEEGTSQITITGFDAAASTANGGTGLGITAAGDWTLASGTDPQLDIDLLDTATSTLRTEAKSLSNNMSVITTRQDFTEKMINTLEDGAVNLTIADMNEEGANMLMLQTRQALGTTSLSLASQAAQSVLRLF